MEIMPILERKIAHKMTTLCSHITYPEFVLPLHPVWTVGCLSIQIWLSQKWLSVSATIRRLSSSSSFRKSSILLLQNVAGKSMGQLSDGERMSVSLLNSLVSRFLRDTNGLRPVNEMRLFSLSAMLERLIPLLYRIFWKIFLNLMLKNCISYLFFVFLQKDYEFKHERYDITI